MEFFMRCREFCVFLVLLLFSVLVVSGCAVDKRPDAYANAIVVNSAFPAHGSSLEQYGALQNALLSRNLLIADNGDVLPVMKDMCDADMLYRVTDTQLPPYIGQHQDLYSGFYLDVALVNGNWKVVSTDNDFVQFEPVFDLELLATILNPSMTSADAYIVRPQPGLSTKALGDLLASMRGLLPTKRTRFVVPRAYLSQVEQAGYRGVLYNASASHLYLAATLATSAAQDRVFLQLNSNANAEVSAMAVSAKPLMACIQNNNFVPPPGAVFNGQSTQANLPGVVSMLPKNADFNQLSEQQRLFKSGQYLTLGGDVLTYSTYQKMQGSSRCSRLLPSDPLFKYCEDRKQDASTEFKRKKATMRKQGS